MRDRFHWARLLAFVTGLVNQNLLLRNEDLIAENRILRAQSPTRLRLSDPERATWLRSPSGLAPKRCMRSHKWPNQTPFSAGIGASLRRSSTDRGIVSIPVALECLRNLRR
jgi:hypothetical protein